MLPLRPALYDVGASPASSSSVMPFVSGTRRDTTVPQSMNRAKICISLGSQGEQVLPEQFAAVSLDRNGVLTTCARMAPILPMAAETPCPVERYRVGKHSPGMMNVVVLGPPVEEQLSPMPSAQLQIGPSS